MFLYGNVWRRWGLTTSALPRVPRKAFICMVILFVSGKNEEGIMGFSPCDFVG